MSVSRVLRTPAALLCCLTTSMLIGTVPASAAIELQDVANFAVLGASTVTNTGATTIVGDIGLSPGTAITGYGSMTHMGTLHIADATAALAQVQAVTVAATLAGLPFVTDLTGQDLGSVGTLTPGVYRFASSAQLTGNLVLDFAGNAASAFVFQIGSTLTTASASNVTVLNGGAGSGIFWNVGSAATLGTGSTLAGNIFATSSATLNTGASILCGRVVALNGAVTLDGNMISNNCSGAGALGSGRSDFGSYGFAGAVPEPSAWAMLIIGFGATGAAMRRRQPVVA
jgi:type VI secretion system secreted protein VgrG